MTTEQARGVDDLRSAPTSPCPCGRGDVASELERQRPLLERAIAGDAGAFAELYEEQVDDVYRYLLAWTADDASARDLTERVFQGALTWLPVIAEGEGDLAAWLMTMARDSVVQHRGADWAATPEQVEGQSPDVLVAARQLDDAKREVVVMRLLLGHSLAHTAHLTGYSPRVVSELQLAACSSIWELLSGTTVDPAPPGGQELRPRWFEGSLEGAYFDPSGDPGLSDVLAVADALRQAAPQQVPLPDDVFLQRLRGLLLGEFSGGAAETARPRPAGGIGRAFGLVRFYLSRHPWAATIVAASAIGLVFGLQVASNSGTHSACGDGPCLASTTAANPDAQAGVASIPTLGATTIFTTTSAPPSTLPPTTRAPAASSTVPPTTVARTTQTTQRATTTTRRHGPPTTTSPPPTTAEPTTTTATPG